MEAVIVVSQVNLPPLLNYREKIVCKLVNYCENLQAFRDETQKAGKVKRRVD